MMRRVRATLAADGPSDRVLIHPIRWLIGEVLNPAPVELDLAFASVTATPLHSRIDAALREYPCDVLLVHRDAEGQRPDRSRREIHEALRRVSPAHSTVHVVPVRMTEAWLLADQRAIRLAAGNPDGRERLTLPPLRRLESAADPKAILREALVTASALRGRKLQRFRRDMGQRVLRVAELIEDYASLRALSAFTKLESDLRRALAEIG